MGRAWTGEKAGLGAITGYTGLNPGFQLFGEMLPLMANWKNRCAGSWYLSGVIEGDVPNLHAADDDCNHISPLFSDDYHGHIYRQYFSGKMKKKYLQGWGLPDMLRGYEWYPKRGVHHGVLFVVMEEG